MTHTSSALSRQKSSGSTADVEVDPAVGIEVEGESAWGRLMYSGGVDYAVLGRKDKPTNPDLPDVSGPHIVRALSTIKFAKIFSSHSSSHCIAIDVAGQAYVFGRNANGQLGIPNKPGETSIWPPVKLEGYESLSGKRKIVAAATGRNHTLLVNDRGEVWAAGQNTMGQCGHHVLNDLPKFRRIEGPLLKEKIIMASAGINFSLVLTSKGRVWAFGSPEKGQLGNGRTGEYIAASKSSFQPEPDPLLIKAAFDKKKIVKIASGQQHSLALDSDGYVYSWGFGGLGRLGHGAQVDLLLPKAIMQFTGAKPITRAANICCGSTNSMVVDGQKMVWLFGKWKTSGDGSAGQPWMSPKVIPDLMGHKIQLISAGGVTLFCVADDEAKDPKGEGTITIGWGQNANNGELGFGPDIPRSATKPTRITTLDGIEIIDIAAAQNTTYFLARPPASTPLAESEDGAASTASAPNVAAPGSDFFYNPFAPPTLEVPGPSASAGASPAPEDAGTPQGSAAAGAGMGTDAGQVAQRSRTNPDKWADMPRFPNAFEATDICLVCGIDRVEDEPLECEKCGEPFHLRCLDPPLDSIPIGEWFCPPCLDQPMPAPPAAVKPTGKGGKGARGKAAPPAAAVAPAATNSRKRKADDTAPPAPEVKKGRRRA